MSPSDIQQALRQTNIHPSRKLGQNFLCDANISREIVNSLELEPDDIVVEVGPGFSSLSEHLVGQVKKIILIEFDHRLFQWLTAKFSSEPSVEVIHADGAQFDVRTLFKEGSIKFLGNLPYSAGGAILRNFFQPPSPVSHAVVMVQKEFADRMMASPRTKDYGVLSLRMQAYWDLEQIKTVPPHVFYPVPAVDSTVLTITPRVKRLPPFDGLLFDSLIRRGFAQRRKQLKKSMPSTPAWSEVTQSLGMKETLRAEELSIEQWVQLSRLYDHHPLKDTPQTNEELFDVVDQDDQVIGQATRQDVHTQNLIHRAVHLFVLNKHQELFLQKRSHLKDTHPGQWDSSAAGHLDSGESYEEAGHRELLEELNLSTDSIEWIGKLPPTPSNGFEHIHIGLIVYSTSTPSIRFPCSEVEAGFWMPLTEVMQWVQQQPSQFAPGFLACWEQLKAHLTLHPS